MHCQSNPVHGLSLMVMFASSSFYTENTGLSELATVLSRIRCGRFVNAKNGDIIQIVGGPVTVISVLFVMPRYNTGTTIRCNFSTATIYAGESTFKINAYDTETGTAPESTTLAGSYIIVPLDQ